MKFLESQFRESFVVFDAMADDAAHNFVGFTEGNAFAHQVVGNVGRLHKPFVGSDLHVLTINGNGWRHTRENAQAYLQGIARIEQRLL
ncbi:MAG: hypothetical protein U9Q79_07970, partial [Candidatus Hydrogenedentes bacterium]|nr:hypothetical protein [Candidatus Hydrogenedentota bacterium]